MEPTNEQHLIRLVAEANAVLTDPPCPDGCEPTRGRMEFRVS